LRRLPVGKNIVYDYIPVDIVVNSLIVAGYNVDRDRYNFKEILYIFYFIENTYAFFEL